MARTGSPKLADFNRRTAKAEVRAARNEQMLEVLRRLCAKRRNGVPMSSREIARACGYDHQHILNLERSALRKMRLRLPPDVRESFDELIARHRTTATPKSNV